MQLFCSPTDLESVDGTTVLGKLDWTSQYNDPSISSSYQRNQHMVFPHFFLSLTLRLVAMQVQ